jgi:transposase-like protein
MPQAQMPFFPQGVIHINPMLAFSKENGRIAYVTAGMQLYTHAENDRVAFLMITAQFCANGMAKQAEIARAFGVPLLSIKRAVKLFREEGTRGFFKLRKSRSAAVLTPDVLAQVQGLFDGGLGITEVAGQIGLKRDTLAKAVRAGRLRAPACVTGTDIMCSKSERSEQDSEAPMGMGASNVAARVAASLGQVMAVAPLFQASLACPSAVCCLRCLPCWRWIWRSAAHYCRTICGSGKSESEGKTVIRRLCCQPITGRKRHPWQGRCSPDGLRKTISDIPATTSGWTGWRTIPRILFLIP